MNSTPAIRERNQAEQRRRSAIDNVMERLDVIVELHDYNPIARRRQAEDIVDAVLAITRAKDEPVYADCPYCDGYLIPGHIEAAHPERRS